MNFEEITNLLITGGTGSFGNAFIPEALKRLPNLRRLVIFSRDELKQFNLQQKYPPHKYPQLRFIIGNVRDLSSLSRACEGIDSVIHAAALKQVPAAEYNPIEFIKTNILGAENIVQASITTSVKQVVALSSDKATSPINLYGATKLCSDKLFIAANNIIGKKNKHFSVVRYGNVMGSRGSVIPFFIEKSKTGKIPITSLEMTRFNISLSEAVDMVFWSLENSKGGELFIPKIPSYRITDLAKAIAPSCKLEIIGIRPGEKLHEEMISLADAVNTIDLGKYYAILPPGDNFTREKLEKNWGKFKFIEKDFSYNSKNNSDFLNINQIRALIKEHLDNSFVPR